MSAQQITLSPAALAALETMRARGVVPADATWTSADALLGLLTPEERDALLPLAARLCGASPEQRARIARWIVTTASLVDLDAAELGP